METLEIVAYGFRFGLILIYLFLMQFFWRRYAKSKQAGFPNKFFLGFGIFFSIVIFVISILIIYEFLSDLIPNFVDLKGMFAGGEDPQNLAQVGIFSNMVRPVFVFFFIVVNLIIAAQIYPLELIMEWKRTPFTKLLIISSSLMVLIYIPALTYTLYTPIAFVIFFIAIAFGFFLDIGVNIKLFIKSTGQLRKNAFLIILAFFFFYAGFAMSLELGWMQYIWTGFSSNQWDIIFGVCLQAIGALFYKMGFSQEELS